MTTLPILTISVSDDVGYEIITYTSMVIPRIGEELNFTCDDGKTVQGTVNEIIHIVRDTDTGKVCNKILVSVKNIEFL